MSFDVSLGRCLIGSNNDKNDNDDEDDILKHYRLVDEHDIFS